MSIDWTDVGQSIVATADRDRFGEYLTSTPTWIEGPHFTGPLMVSMALEAIIAEWKMAPIGYSVDGVICSGAGTYAVYGIATRGGQTIWFADTGIGVTPLCLYSTPQT